MRIFSLPELRSNEPSYAGSGNASPLVGLPTYHELRPMLELELRRCRRYERPLTVLVVGLQRPAKGHGNGRGANGNGKTNGNGANGHLTAAPLIPSSLTAQLGFLMLGSLLRGTVRETDIVAYAPEAHHFVVALPESDLAAGELAVGRLNDLCFERTSLVLRVGIACYPADGLSLHDLVEHARHAWRDEPLIEPVARPDERNAK